MKLDMDLFRKILIWCEEYLPAEDQDYKVGDIKISGYDTNQILYHVTLLVEENFLKVIDVSDLSGNDYILQRLTFNGHQFLKIIENDTLWNKLKEKLEGVGLAALPVIIPIVTPYIKQLLGLPTIP